jgi:sugar phosphate isomerase/epimerase
MRFGCITTEIGRIERLAATGFDYVELRARALAPVSDEVAFLSILERLRDAPLRVEALCGFIPPFVNLKVVGPSADRSKLKRYTETMLDRAARLGASVIVFGSGAARAIPEGFSRGRAQEQFRDYLALAVDLATPRNLTIALEVLNHDETNLVTTPAEAVALVKSVGRPRLRIAVDHYHLLSEDQPISEVIALGQLVGHVHASGPDRLPPAPGAADQYDLMAALQALGYDARISVESRFTDFDHEASVALAHLRSAWAEATVASPRTTEGHPRGHDAG